VDEEQKTPAGETGVGTNVATSSAPVLNGLERIALQDKVVEALRTCYDPEIPVNIVDLGLIYSVKFDPAPDDKQDVNVDMTLTAQGCPEHVNISMQVKSRLEQLPGIRNAAVNVVWTPPWTPERLSADARKQLGIE
jgi:metal-sulfur cluster biosynthetic enzyme